MTGSEPTGGRSFAEKLNHLIKHVHPASRGAYTSREIAEATGLSTTYIDNLRNGKQDNPTRTVIASLGKLFRVPPAYFFDDGVAAQTDADLSRAVALAAALQNSNVERFALRAAKLDPEVVAALIEMVERLPPARGDAGPNDRNGRGQDDR